MSTRQRIERLERLERAAAPNATEPRLVVRFIRPDGTEAKRLQIGPEPPPDRAA